MREIKFRGKAHDGEWVYGDLVHDIRKPKRHKRKRVYIGVYDRRFHPIEVNPETLGQYTGLKDKNGKEIYEGDILWIPWWNGINGKIVYDSGKFMFIELNADPLEGTTVVDLYDLFYEDGDEIEVIGNIHDNPELLEVSNEN